MTANERPYLAENWPHGLRCCDCSVLFVDGMPIAERLFAMSEFAFEPMFCVELICQECAVAGRANA